MTGRRVLASLVVVLTIAGVAVGLWWWRVREADPAPIAAAPAGALSAPATTAARIGATIYAVAADGDYLVASRREIPLAVDAAAQGREILLAALHPPDAPLLPAIPAGVTLRGFFLMASGDAFVDLGGDTLTSFHPGATAERLFVYALVQSLTASLPAARRVQLLVNGAEVDSLGGHLDLREPLPPDPALLASPVAAPAIPSPPLATPSAALGSAGTSTPGGLH